MLRHPDITRRRVGQLRAMVEAAVEVEPLACEVSAWSAPGEPVPFEEALAAPYGPFAAGDAWGPAWTTTWFRLRATLPARWTGRRVVAALNITGGGAEGTGFTGEGLVYRDGHVLQGVSPNHHHVVLADPLAGEEAVELYIEAAANPELHPGHPALTVRPDPHGPPLFRLTRADVCVVDAEVAAVAHDLRVLDELLSTLPAGSARAGALLLALNDACNALNPRDVRGSLDAVRACYADVLHSPAAASSHGVTAVGHAHIDSAWLWPVRETRRKVTRTFSTALALMDEYEDYRFAASQPAQYEWLRTDHPELFARLRDRVRSGQWEPVGAMYVEADCNISSGESLVRQLLYGKRWFLEHLDHETHEVWLPDVFGYAANLPQLFRKAGVDFFLTQKLSWNQFNRLPSSTFWWEGIDGSRVLTHFPPADTYNGSFDVREVVASAEQHRDAGRSDRSLYLFGHGDGGGGPTRQMIESARRLGDLEGAPRVSMGSVAQTAAAMAAEARDLTTWVGELYFELHRGTYTTQAKTKLGNRRCELLLRDAEMLAVVTGRRDADTRELLARSWRTVLFNQFHDIIPGSSISWVYEEAERDYARVESEVGSLRDACLQTLARCGDGEGESGTVLVVNTASSARRGVVGIDLDDGEPVPSSVSGRSTSPVQVITGDDTRRRALFVAEAPPCGAAVHHLEDAGPSDPGRGGVTATDDSLENEFLLVRFGDGGVITSILDKRAGREVVAPGARANLLQLHEDRPLAWDAWDVDIYHRETAEDLDALESSEVSAAGPVRATHRQVRRFGNSRLTQWISLDAGSPMIRFETEVDWHEDQRLLKATFPVAVHAPTATYEVQFGAVQRPTHFNTTWDLARFEVCAHRWADLSDSRYGVALLNDCKYGHDIHGNVMRLSLLRAPTYPDPLADRGLHRFTYALMPHTGSWQSAGVVAAADELNSPMFVTRVAGEGDRSGPAARWLDTGADGVAVSALKWAEDSDEAVVRIYEMFGGRTTAHLSTTLPFRTAMLTDLLERDLEPLEVDEAGRITVELGPFEVATVALRR